MREKIEYAFWEFAREREFLQPFGNIGRLAAAASIIVLLASFAFKSLTT